MKTTHSLDFEVCEWEIGLGEWQRFRVGTCEGLWKSTKDSYQILAITNKEPGNGHLTDVLEWFENSCKRDKKSLKIMEVWNPEFKNHLIEKRGFEILGDYHLIKVYEINQAQEL